MTRFSFISVLVGAMVLVMGGAALAAPAPEAALAATAPGGGGGGGEPDPCCQSGTDYCASIEVDEELPDGEKVELEAACIVHTDDGFFVEGFVHAKVTNRDGVEIVNQRVDITRTGGGAANHGEPVLLDVEPRTDDLVLFDEGDLCIPVVGCNRDPIAVPLVQPETFQRVKVLEGGATVTASTPITGTDVTITEGCASPAWADDDKKCGENGNEDLAVPTVQP